MYYYCLNRFAINSFEKIKVTKAEVTIENIFDDVAFASITIVLEIPSDKMDIRKIKKRTSAMGIEDKSRASKGIEE